VIVPRHFAILLLALVTMIWPCSARASLTLTLTPAIGIAKLSLADETASSSDCVEAPRTAPPPFARRAAGPSTNKGEAAGEARWVGAKIHAPSSGVAPGRGELPETELLTPNILGVRHGSRLLGGLRSPYDLVTAVGAPSVQRKSHNRRSVHSSPRSFFSSRMALQFLLARREKIFRPRSRMSWRRERQGCGGTGRVDHPRPQRTTPPRQ
jgi:hypothetical protein